MSSSNQEPPFIADQGMRLLKETRDPWRYLQADQFRQQRLREPGPLEQRTPEQEAWAPVDRRQVAFNRVSDCDLRRLVVTTDAGVGKTTTMQWLQAVLSRPGPVPVPFLVDVARLPTGATDEVPTELVLDHLATILCKAGKNRRGSRRKPGAFTFDDARLAVTRLLRQGRLILLLDGLDQTHSEDARIQRTLLYLLEDEAWRDCRIVIGSRPYALELHRHTLFENTGPWRFLQLDEFDEEQQCRYLGDERFEAVPEDARQILTVPRVLSYLRGMDEPDVAKIRTASDVYWYATSKMLTEAMKARDAAGLHPNEARMLLAAIGFEMVTSAARLDGVDQGQMPGFELDLGTRCAGYHGQYDVTWCREKLKQLAAMNEFLSHGLLEGGCPQQIQWRNPSLGEFFAGLWLSLFCTEADRARLDESIYLAHEPASRRYYWMWRFAAEMPTGGRDPVRWARAMSRVYQPGDGTVQGTRRSTEIIYRSYTMVPSAAEAKQGGKVKQLHDEFQSRCLGPYQAELPQEILSGNRDQDGVEWQHQSSFIMVEFRAEREGPEKHRFGFRRIPPDENHSLHFTMGEGSRAWRTAIEKAFFLACTPTTNGHYELFDPSHRERGWYRGGEEVARADDADQCPVVRVSFYDAWAFCLWLGSGYSLPTEKQWEYACRAGSTTRWCFGDDEEQLREYVWYYKNSGGKTHPVGVLAANAWGLLDVHGNVFEWCDTWYDRDLATSDNPAHRGSARVLRGGSWVRSPRFTRSASPDVRLPTVRNDYVGFRVASALH